MRCFVVVLALVACGKSENKAAPATSETPAAKSESKTAPPTVEIKEKRFCKRVDTDPIAKVLEIEKLSRTGNGTLIKGGGEPASLVCSYYEGSKVDGGMGLRISLKATTDFEKADTLRRYEWADFDGLGQPAKIGRGKDIVAVQTIANGAQLVVDDKHPSIPVADLEKRAVAATKLVMQQLPADATSELK